MSVLQRITQVATAAIPIIENNIIPIIDNIIVDKRIIFICSRSLSDLEITSLKQHGVVLEYSSSLFSAVMDLTTIKFDYLIFNISDTDAKNWISTNLSNIKLRMILVKNSYESDTETWMLAIPHLNIIKKIPILNINKEQFENQILNSVHIPHSRGLGERFFKKVFSCFTDAGVETISQTIAQNIV